VQECAQPYLHAVTHPITPLSRQTQEVCDFLNTSSENAHKHTKTCKSFVSTYNQPNLESTQNQPRFLRLKFWALVTIW
jgi:hypothetical protein